MIIMFINFFVFIVAIFCAVYAGIFISGYATRLKNTFFFLTVFFFFLKMLFLAKWRESTVKFFSAPSSKLEVLFFYAALLCFYGIWVLISKGINVLPLLNVIFFSWGGNAACVLIFLHLFFIFFNAYYFKAPVPPLLSIFVDVVSLILYSVVFYISVNWPYYSLFTFIFIFFEIIIFLTKKDLGEYSKLLRIPLLGFYAGVLSKPTEIIAASNNPEHSGSDALRDLIYWLYDVTGIPVSTWRGLHSWLVDADNFFCSTQFYNWLLYNFSKPSWILCTLVFIFIFFLSYAFEKQWSYFLSFFNLLSLRFLSYLLPLGFLIFFLKNWVYFHMFVFVILFSEITIFFLKKFGVTYSWMLRFPVAGFLFGVVSMPIENIPLELALQPRGYFATMFFVYFIWDSILFDFSYDKIIDFHDFLVTISDPALYFFDTVFGNAALTNALYAIIYAVTILTIIIVIAFFTVFERKVLAAVQRRRGPNIVGVWGLLQAIADALKLLSKEPLFVSGVNYYIFLLAPIFLFTISLTAWVFIPIPGYQFNVSSSYTFLLVFLITGLNSFAIILAGISSNSRYSLIGGIRAIAQLISYEIPLSITILILFIIQGSFDLHQFVATKIILTALALPALLIFFVCLLAETNRTPFDLPEAEAELVAGYNLEYSSILFALFFLAEYNNIMIASSLLSIMFFGESFFYVGVIVFCAIIIFVRAILPRYTFAQLINLCWTVLFPAALVLLILIVVFMYLFDISTHSLVRLDVIEAIDNILKESKEFIFSNIYNIAHGAQIYNSGTPKFNVFIFFIVAFVITSLLVGLNWVLVNFKSNNRKNSPYECGFEPVGSPISDFTPNFLAVALIFLIYDVEILLTFPWAYSFYAKSAAAVFCFVFFLIIMLLGLIYEVLDDSFTVY